MTNEDAIKQLTSIKGQIDNQSMALAVALDILAVGYKSDKDAIQAAKDETAGVQTKLDALKASVAAV